MVLDVSKLTLYMTHMIKLRDVTIFVGQYRDTQENCISSPVRGYAGKKSTCTRQLAERIHYWLLSRKSLFNFNCTLRDRFAEREKENLGEIVKVTEERKTNFSSRIPLPRTRWRRWKDACSSSPHDHRSAAIKIEGSQPRHVHLSTYAAAACLRVLLSYYNIAISRCFHNVRIQVYVSALILKFKINL